MNHFKEGKYSFNSNNSNKIELLSMNSLNNNKIPLFNLFKSNNKFFEKFLLSLQQNTLLNKRLMLQRSSNPFPVQHTNFIQNPDKYNFKNKGIIYKKLNIIPSNKTYLQNNQFTINKETNKLKKNSIDILKYINYRNIIKRKENNLLKKEAYSSRDYKNDTTDERYNKILRERNSKNLDNCILINDVKYLESDPKIFLKNKSETIKALMNNKLILPKMDFKHMKSIDKKIKNEYVKNNVSYEVSNKFNLQNNKNKIIIPKIIFNKNKEKKTKEIKTKINLSIEVKSVSGTHLYMNKLNQDTYLIYPDIKLVDNIDNENFIQIFGVFDGHGDNGHIISKEIKEYFLQYFNQLNLAESEEYYKKLCENNHEVIFNLFKEIDKKLHDKYSDEDKNICNNSGSTASLVILFRNKIISINLGHSKSILIYKDNKIIQLNRCHLPELEEEKRRIEENGGEVRREEWSKDGPKRICYKKGETKKYSGLSVSRSFGDFDSEQIGVIAIPEIKEFDVNYNDINIMVMCTNGIWEFLTNEKVKDIILPYYEENNISGGINKLINVSNKIWSVKNPMYIDDLSSILLFFNHC